MSEIATLIRDILEPAPREEMWDGAKVWVQDDAYYELEAVIQDLRHRCPDEKICINTLNRVQSKIAEVMKLVGRRERTTKGAL